MFVIHKVCTHIKVKSYSTDTRWKGTYFIVTSLWGWGSGCHHQHRIVLCSCVRPVEYKKIHHSICLVTFNLQIFGLYEPLWRSKNQKINFCQMTQNCPIWQEIQWKDFSSQIFQPLTPLELFCCISNFINRITESEILTLHLFHMSM